MFESGNNRSLLTSIEKRRQNRVTIPEIFSIFFGVPRNCCLNKQLPTIRVSRFFLIERTGNQ